MPTVEEAINRVKGMGSQHVAVAIWCEDDVRERAKELDIPITREQAADIIDEIDHKQDCSIGISWDMIDNYLLDIKLGK